MPAGQRHLVPKHKPTHATAQHNSINAQGAFAMTRGSSSGPAAAEIVVKILDDFLSTKFLKDIGKISQDAITAADLSVKLVQKAAYFIQSVLDEMPGHSHVRIDGANVRFGDFKGFSPEAFDEELGRISRQLGWAPPLSFLLQHDGKVCGAYLEEVEHADRKEWFVYLLNERNCAILQLSSILHLRLGHAKPNLNVERHNGSNTHLIIQNSHRHPRETMMEILTEAKGQDSLPSARLVNVCCHADLSDGHGSNFEITFKTHERTHCDQHKRH